MSVARVAEIRRYPVKSMGGEQLDAAPIGERGLPGDRAWALRDEQGGGIRGAKKFPELMRCRARYLEPPALEGSSPAEITLPDGARVSTGAEDVGERLSKLVDHPVTLWPLMPPEMLEHYRRGAPASDDAEQELRALFGRTPDEPLPDLSVFPPEIFEYESPPGTYFDAYPLLVMTRASLETLQARAAESRFDVRRFRPNLLLEDTAAEEPFPENAWSGKTLRIGEARIRVEAPCPRCVMTTHGFDDLPKDTDVMRALVREANGNLGVYAKVEAPGTIRVGDPVELV